MGDRRFRLYEAKGKKWMESSDRLEILQRIVRDYLDEGYVQTSSGNPCWAIVRHPDSWGDWLYIYVDAAGTVAVTKNTLMVAAGHSAKKLRGL